MENYSHITNMENILVQQTKTLTQLNAFLDCLEAQRKDYTKLVSYYYSEQRAQDLEDDSRHLIPQTLHRGVLSEDEIFDLMGEYRNSALRMMEIALHMMKD